MKTIWQNSYLLAKLLFLTIYLINLKKHGSDY
jgi:hypothetical protein